MSTRVVISSLTGKPMAWDEEPAEDDGPPKGGGSPGDAGPDGDEEHEARLLRDLPPHWGRGA